MSKKSGCTNPSQTVRDPKEQPLGRFVASRAQDGSAGRPDQPSGAMKELEAQGVNALQHMERGAFRRATARRGSGFDLEVGIRLCARATNCCQALLAP